MRRDATRWRKQNQQVTCAVVGNRWLRWAVLACFCPTICSTIPAQEFKPTIHVWHYNHKAFIAEVSLLAAAKSADAITTRQLLDRGGWENNPVFGRHPSPGKQAGINAGIFAAQSAALYFTERSRHSWIRWTGRAFLAHAIEEHARLAACNAGIDTRSPAITHCEPFAPF